MTRTEHLERIKARCEMMLSMYADSGICKEEVAAWKSTIAAIDCLSKQCCKSCDSSGVINHGGSGEGEENLEYCPNNCQGIFYESAQALDSIISAWLEELL